MWDRLDKRTRWTALAVVVGLLAACQRKSAPPGLSPPPSSKAASVNDTQRDLDDEDDGFGGAGAWMPSCELYAQGKRDEALARLRAEHPGKAVLAKDSEDTVAFVCRSLNRLQEECHRFEIEGVDGLLPPGVTDPKDRTVVNHYYLVMCPNLPKH